MKVDSTVAGTNFFRAYAEYTKLDKIIRAGFPLWGVYGSTRFEVFDLNRKQSDLEHCAGMSFIAAMLPVFYPDIFPIQDSWKYQLATILHELGEIPTGDIPDDGRINSATKDLWERDYIFGFIDNLWPESWRTEAKNFIVEMQEKSTPFGKTMFLIDKIEAILRGFAYEFQGKIGKISLKNFRTDRDDAEYAFTEKENLADNWLYGLFQTTNPKDYPDLPIFIEICQSASCLVRGEPLTWLEKINF